MLDEEKNSSELAETLEARTQALIIECRNADPEGRRVIILELIDITEKLAAIKRSAEDAERIRRQELLRACPDGGFVGEVVSEIAPSDIHYKRINFAPAIRKNLILPGETLTVCLAGKTYVKTFDWSHSPRHMTCGPLAGILFDSYKGNPAGSKYKIERKAGHTLVITPIISLEEA